jgi:seryl-tRNA synthetase
VKNEDGSNQILHTLNGTGIAVGRCLIAIMENYQTKEGEILVPKALHKWLPFTKIAKK